MKSLFVCTLALAILGQACNNEKKDKDTTTDTTTIVDRDTTQASPVVTTAGHAQAILMETKSDTAVSGTVTFDTTSGGKVKMMLDITVAKMANKTVSVHIHEHGDCGDQGMASHNHWNPTNENHGKWGSSAYHLGDIGNVKLDGSGKGTLTMDTDKWTIGGNASTNILGKAVIIHSGTDDYKTQPSGNSGSRIACGVIQ